MSVGPLFPVRRHVTRKKQFDERDCREEILEFDKAVQVKYFLFWLIAITSLKGRLKEPMVFKDIFGIFLARKL